MNKEEIQKLIGGYATGSLTEEERRILFDAALDDQEVFDTLQKEQALKEVFDDPLSREQVRRAAAESLPSPKRAWFRLPWIWAAGASVATAAVLLVVLLQPGRQQNAVHVAPPKQIAASPAQPQLDVKESAPAVQDKKSTKAAKPVADTLKPAELVKKKEETRADVPPPPSPPPVAVQTSQVPSGPSQSPANQIQSLEAKDASQEKAPVSEQTTPSPAAGFRAQKALAAPTMGRMAAPATAPTIYSLVRRLDNGSYLDVPVDTVFQPGEIIRLTIFARAAGPLTVMEWDADNSQWNRIFPLEGETVQAPALVNYVVPRDITVKSGERLRVTVGPLATGIEIRTTAAR